MAAPKCVGVLHTADGKPQVLAAATRGDVKLFLAPETAADARWRRRSGATHQSAFSFSPRTLGGSGEVKDASLLSLPRFVVHQARAGGELDEPQAQQLQSLSEQLAVKQLQWQQAYQAAWSPQVLRMLSF